MSLEYLKKYTCTYCQEDITSLRVKCQVCDAFELCLQCFSEGAESGPHKKDHAYQLVDSVALNVFRGDHDSWSGRELILLLEALELYSYGDWETISKHIVTRTPDEARNEYISRFIEGRIGRHTWVPSLHGKWRLTDHTADREDDLTTSDKLASSSDTVIKEEHAIKLDYKPLIDKFVNEDYDNEAELLICRLTWSPDEDDKLSIAMKATLADMYTERLRDRAKSHTLIQQNQLIERYFESRDKKTKKLSREEKDFEDKLRPLCKLQDYSALNGLRRIRWQSQKLSNYMRYRRNGLVHGEEIRHFEQERLLRHNGKSGTASQKSTNVYNRSKQKDAMVRCNDVEPQTSSNLLSPAEAQLCRAMDMTPTQYVSVKALMLVNPEMKVEGECGQHILDYLATSGWVCDASNYS